jgi:hypothetical protein
MDTKRMHWAMIATLHFLIAGLTIPFIATSLAYLVFYAFGIDGNGLTSLIIIPLVLFVSIWIGVKYSGKFISRTFDLAHRTGIVNFSTVCFVVLVVVFTYGLIIEMMNSGMTGSEFYAISGLMGAISLAEIFIFYRDSVKYVA